VSWSWTNIDWNGTAAMVQAVGSVLAILAAVAIDQGTARRERRARQEEQAATLMAASQLVSLLRIKADSMLDTFKEVGAEPNVGEPIRKDCEVMASTIRSFPVATLGQAQAIVSYCDAMRYAEMLVLLLGRIDDHAERAGPGDPSFLVEWAIEHLQPLAELIRACDERLATARGSNAKQDRYPRMQNERKD